MSAIKIGLSHKRIDLILILVKQIKFAVCQFVCLFVFWNAMHSVAWPPTLTSNEQDWECQMSRPFRAGNCLFDSERLYQIFDLSDKTRGINRTSVRNTIIKLIGYNKKSSISINVTLLMWKQYFCTSCNVWFGCPGLDMLGLKYLLHFQVDNEEDILRLIFSGKLEKWSKELVYNGKTYHCRNKC
jgi:hypothetical protein